MFIKLQTLLHQCDVFYKIARKAEDLTTLKSNLGKYVHFSNSDRFGISYHKNIHPGNPRAIYGFPLTPGKFQKIVENIPDAFYDYGYSKYIYIFEAVGNVLDMDNLNLPELVSRARAFVLANYPKGAYHTLYIPTPGPYTRTGAEFLNWLGRISQDIFKNEHAGINVLLRGMGYDAIETRNYGFGDDLASEIAVLNPSAVNLIAKIDNPMLTKEQIKEIDWYNSPEYAKQQKEKKSLLDKQQKEKKVLLDKHLQKADEERVLYEKERPLLREKKFDEVDALRQQFKAKWQDLPPL